MADGIEKRHAGYVPDCELGDLVIEVNEALDDDFAGTGATTFLRVIPRLIAGRLGLHCALTLARRTHYGFYDAGQADLGDRLIELRTGLREAVR